MENNSPATVANITLAEVLAAEIQLKREQALRDRTSAYSRTHSILSDIGECDRQMVMAVFNWKDRPPIDPDLKARFEAGNLQEREVVNELRSLGYDVILQQEPVEIKNRAGELIARGKVDGHIKYHGIKIPVEVKSMHPIVYDQIDTLDDFRRKPYLRKYLRQLAMYLYGNNVEEGLFLLTDCLGHWKILVLTLDFGEGEQILQRLERVHLAIKAGTLPDRIEYRDDICGKCPFSHVCLADVIRTEMQILDDEDFLQHLQIREANKEAKTAFESSDKKAKDYLKKNNITKGIAGEFIINATERIRKAQEAKPESKFIVYDIGKLDGKEVAA